MMCSRGQKYRSTGQHIRVPSSSVHCCNMGLGRLCCTTNHPSIHPICLSVIADAYSEHVFRRPSPHLLQPHSKFDSGVCTLCDCLHMLLNRCIKLFISIKSTFPGATLSFGQICVNVFSTNLAYQK